MNMRINQSNQINFCKQLKASCKVLKFKIPASCSIYELTQEDRDYFETKQRAKDWKNSCYLDCITQDLDKDNLSDNKHIFIMEDRKGNCLAFASTEFSNFHKRKLDLMYFEALPNFKKKLYKYIGETFINFLCGYTENESTKMLSVPSPRKDALPFYNKSHFKAHPTMFCDNNISLYGKNMEKLIAQNEEHTKNKIDYVL